MQKINILGVELTDYSLKESLLRLDGYVRGGGLNTILYITTPVLIMAGENEEEKKQNQVIKLLCKTVTVSFIYVINTDNMKY